jgi:hypothetical protein
VPVANTTAQHRRLSWRAKGLLVDLLSYPDGYHMTFKMLMDAAKRAGDPDVEGRDAMRKSMQELEKKGYLKHKRIEVKDAQPGEQKWRTETYICDQPIFAGQPGGTDSQEFQGSVPPDFSSPEGQELFNNTGFNKTNLQQEEAGKDSTALAAARAGQHAGANDLPPELADLYEAARKLDEDRLRRLLLQFEDRRPTKYRDARRRALAQLKASDPRAIKEEYSVRSVDELSFMYGLRHYYKIDKPAVGIPVWMRRFPR